MKRLPLLSLKEISESVQYGYTASASDSEIGPKYLRITDIVPSQIDWETVPYCMIDEKNISKFCLKEGDIVIARTGATVGYAKLIRGNVPLSVFASYLVRIRIDSKKANSEYVGRVIESDIYKRFIISRIGGAAQPNANANVLSSFRLHILKEATQRQIASILSAYDDLIDTNRRRIHLLEESARLLFREWFVYFRFPGHEKVKIVDGLPEGWKKGLLEDIAVVRKGKNITFEQAKEGDVPVVGGGLEPTYYHNKANVSAPVITISASGANAGYVNMYDSDIWASDCSYIDKGSTKYIFSLYLRLKSLQTSIFGFQVGAAQPHVYPKNLNRLSLFIATDDLNEQFEKIVTPIFNLIKNLKLENKKLAQARDLLLPRLISGAIEV